MRHYRKGVLLGMSLAEVFILLLFSFSFVLLSDRSWHAKPSTESSAEEETEVVLDDGGKANGDAESADSPAVPSENEQESIYPPDDQTQTSSDPSMSEGLVADKPEEDVFPAAEENAATEQPSPTPAEAESASSKWPPIINLYEAGGYSFPKGQASLSADFVDDLNGPIVSRLLDYIGEYKAKGIIVDVVEVVGHTDEQPVRGYSNLDQQLVAVMRGSGIPDRLSAADNVGLGMARAAAVAQVLRPAMESEGVKVIAYSAGQTIEQGDKISAGQDIGDSARRRRIEIRMRPSMAAEE